MPIENILCKDTTNTSRRRVRRHFHWVRAVHPPSGRTDFRRAPPPTPTSGRHRQLGAAGSLRSEPADSSLPVAEALT
ncbi:unnamed protein product, partial [Rangifer tarandus platyrhynchus]